MADVVTLAPPNTAKPVIVRVKRKAFHSPLDAFWLEIQERPLKRPLIDFGKLSISDASSSRVEELGAEKILVQHLETVTSSEDTFDVLRSFVPSSSGELKSKGSNEEGRRSFKTVNKQDQLLFKAKESKEVFARNARFEQIWRSRNGDKIDPEDKAIDEICRLYDVVRVDEEHEVEVQKERDTDLDDCRMMAEYLPLLREVLPSAASEIDYDMSKQASSDGYVYDFYVVKEDANVTVSDSEGLFPLIQVEEEFYDGPDDSEYETDDSNAENNPVNDYPEEETTEEDADDEDENTSRSSDEESDGESRTSGSQSEEEEESGSKVYDEYDEMSGPYDDWSDDENQFFEDDLYSDGDNDSLGE